MGNLYTIAAGFSFVDELAAGILDRYGNDPIALAGVTVLLPTRRACRSLRDAFLRLSNGRPLLLPTLSPLGDLDAEGLGLALEELPHLAGALDLPPAIGDLRRRLLLTRLILRAPDLAVSATQAVRLAADLTRLLDQVETERLGFDRLAGLVPAEYARHWQITLGFLTILTERWPDILADEGACDAADRRNRVLAAQAAAWRAQPPKGPVIAAGSTGSIAATGELLAVIAGLPAGAVVLPGLDQAADGLAWEAMAADASHPQHTLALLLARLGVGPAAIRPWGPAAEPPRPHRVRLLAEVLRPAATTEDWRVLTGLDRRALDGLTRIDCPTAQDEAEVVALMMRWAVDTSERTAALVTPDRTLARRVAAALGRWGIAVDDSGGQPLADTAAGSFLRLAAAALAEGFAPVPLLALLKHPLAALGESGAACRAFARRLERSALRGPRPAEGIAGLNAAVAASGADPESQAGLAVRLARLETYARPYLTLMASGTAPLAALVRAHVGFAEALAGEAGEPGAERLWRHEDGEAAAGFVTELLSEGADFPALAVADYPGLFEQLLTGRVVRPRFGRHPRLAILGPLEARLQQFDVMILGGLNEGAWPAEPAADPWLSRPMRQAFGLPAPERQIGLSAHDFAQAASAPKVVLTRAERVEGAPTVPSRWLSRLETVLRALGFEERGERREEEQWLAWVRLLDEPDRVRPVAAPEPRPPVAARPTGLSVTEIETWMRNPYAIYARHILDLKALEPIAADPGASERGQFIHAALDGFIRDWPQALPADALDRLLDHGRAAFGDLLARPEVWAFWWPRFERVAAWVVALERRRRPLIRPIATEVSGRLVFQGAARPFTLRAKADRIDRLPDGRVAILDYKTGVLPSERDVAAGVSPQLPLEAVIVAAGGFAGVPAAEVGELAFWRLGGGDPAGTERPIKGDAAALGREARAGLEALIRAFDDPATAYRPRPRPRHAPRFDDYAHLARVQEWSAAGGDPE